MKLAIRLLGPVEVEVEAAPLVVDTRKATALLAWLAVEDRPAARSELAALLWPDSDESAARGALRRTLSVLHAGLGGRGLTITRSSIALDGPWDVDVRRFRAGLAAIRAHGHAAGEPCDACVAALEEIAALDGGPFMAGFSLRDSEPFDEWQRAVADGQRRDLSTVLERLAQARAARGEWSAAIEAGRRWAELDPLHEPAHRLLMLVHARAGEPAAAVAQYRACVRVLDAELGVAPLEETTTLYEAIREGEVPPEPARRPTTAAPTLPPSSTARAASGFPLVGRDAELGALVGAWRSLRPDGRLAIVEGEPGIGKTRLVTALGDSLAAAGATVLRARAYAGEDAIAFTPIAALVRDGLRGTDAAERLRTLPPDVLQAAANVVPALGDAARVGRSRRDLPLDAFGRARAIDALAEVLTGLASGSGGGALLVDDLDWADASSVEVLAFLTRRLRERPLLLVVTWRPLDPGAQDLRRLASSAERDGLAHRVVLDRLSRAEVAELVAAAGVDREASFADALFAESEGLPLYATEVLAAGAPAGGRVPQGVVELLRTRIGSVGDVAGQVLAAAAVVGRSFDFETVRAASGRSEDETVAAIEELVRRGLVTEVGTVDGDVRLDFTHGRLRDAAYEQLGLVRRRLLHGRVADSLRRQTAALDSDWSRWGRIARHETDAGRTAAAAEAHIRAATGARSVFANREAREHLEAALALGGGSAAVHEALGEVLTLLGHYGSAIAHLEAAAAAADASGGWAIERALGLVHARLGDWSRAVSHVDDALTTAPDDPLVRSALLADRSAIAGKLGEAEAATAFARDALAIAERAADATGIARATQVLAVLARSRGDVVAASELLARSLDASAGVPDPGIRIASLNTLALVRASSGHRRAAMELIREALALCERQGDRHRQAALENNLADLLRADGRREEAMEHLKRAVAIFADIGGGAGVPEPEIWKLVEW